MDIRPFRMDDADNVVSLWQGCDLVRPWNDPRRDILRKMQVQSDLFLVGVEGGRIVATVMAGYEGHRGWINYLAVTPTARRRGFGRAMLADAEGRLAALGCPKVNLQVRATNPEAVAFYSAAGYSQDDVVSMGKRIVVEG